jgi:hypothetical protein
MWSMRERKKSSVARQANFTETPRNRAHEDVKLGDILAEKARNPKLNQIVMGKSWVTL